MDGRATYRPLTRRTPALAATPVLTRSASARHPFGAQSMRLARLWASPLLTAVRNHGSLLPVAPVPSASREAYRSVITRAATMQIAEKQKVRFILERETTSPGLMVHANV